MPDDAANEPLQNAYLQLVRELGLDRRGRYCVLIAAGFAELRALTSQVPRKIVEARRPGDRN